MRRLEVYLEERRVGTLFSRSGSTMRFAYDEAWLEFPDAYPLSRSLPLGGAVFPHGKTRAFFSGLLPEGELRKTIAGIFGVGFDNDFVLLEKIGGECAGALRIFPEGGYSPADASPAPRPLTDAELAEIIEKTRRRPLMAGEKNLRLSLAGAQNKLPVVLDADGNVSLPFGGVPSTHILKPESERFPCIAVNEAFCMELAKSAGLNVSGTRYLEIGGRPAVLVERYDRVRAADGTTRRIHQEDFCQALGCRPELKYQQEGGPSVARCLSLLKSWSSAPVRDVPSFMDALAFNAVIGNADAHGKNFSFLYGKSTRALAPFYDLVSTIQWEELSTTAAMKIGGTASIDAFNAGDWKRTAKRNGISWPMLRERMEKLATLIRENMETFPDALRELERRNPPMVARLRQVFSERADKMRRNIAASKR